MRAILADLHLGQATGDEERFVAVLDEVERRGADELVLLGDTFRALVGFARFWDDGVRRCLDRVARLRAVGTRVVMVEGNRDFFLDAHDLDGFRDVSGQAHSFVAGGRRFLLEHGDLVNAGDRQYRFWRALSKGRPARLWARLLPRPLARSIVHRTEARLALTNFTYRTRFPEALLIAAARRHFAAGVDVVMWGHFHRGWRLVEQGREALVVPDWLTTGTVAWVDSAGGVAIESFGGGHFVDSVTHPWYQGDAVQAGTR